MSQDAIIITPNLKIPLGELDLRFSRSGGPGGQHANRSESRVELLFDVSNSPSLSQEQRELIIARLGSWIDGEGVLHLASSESRSQHRNRMTVIARLQSLLQRALRPSKRRHPTRPPRAAQEKRLETKRRQSAKKRARRSGWDSQ